MNEILIYGGIHSFTASDFIGQVNELSDGEELIVRINTDGGSPEAAFGMISKFQEFKGKKSIKVDGKALSMGLFFLAYSDNVEALDVSTFLLHRAAFPSYIESSDSFDNGLKAFLENVNKSLRKALEAKIDVDKFEKISGTTLDEVFSMESRKDVILNAQQAKRIGLIDSINKITPEVKASIDSRFSAIAAKYEAQIPTEENKNQNQNKNQKPKKMTLEELKAAHPALAAQIEAEGVKKGVAHEKDRAGAWLKFNEVDPKAVADGIASNENISQTAMADFSIKMMSAKSKAELEAEATPPVTTDKPKGEEEKTEVEQVEAKLMGTLGLSATK